MRNMVDIDGTSRSVWHGDIRKEGYRDMGEGLEALERVSKSTF